MSDGVFYGIANPFAAGGRIKKSVRDVQSFLMDYNIQLDILWTEKPRHAVEIAEGLVNAGKTHIAALGGDGTAFEAINGVMRSERRDDASLAIIPLGTGNSFLRDFGITTWREAALRVIQGGARKVDIGRIDIFEKDSEESIYFHNMAGFGLIADACRLRHTRFPWMGKYAYHGAFVNLLIGMKTYSLRLEVDGGGLSSKRTPLLALCNSQFTGHNMHLSPVSNVEDGTFELIYAEDMTARELFNLFLKLPSKKHLDHPNVRVQKAKSVDLEVDGIDFFMLDGEIISGRKMHVEMLSRALNVFV